MYPEALAYLGCPRHPEARLLLDAGAHIDSAGAIARGQLRCPACGAVYRIDGGILDLLGPGHLPPSLTQAVNELPVTAWGYERLWRSRALTLLAGEPLGYERELPLVVGLADPARGGLFVDVACSNGLYARAITRARRGAPGPTVGIDHSLPMLRQARDYARAERLRISYVRARAQALPLAAGSAAGLVMGGSLNEIGDADRALAELRRALAPAGRCVMMGLRRADRLPGRLLQTTIGMGGVAFWALDELNRRYAAAGLRLRAQWQYGVVVFSLLTA